MCLNIISGLQLYKTILSTQSKQKVQNNCASKNLLSSPRIQPEVFIKVKFESDPNNLQFCSEISCLFIPIVDGGLHAAVVLLREFYDHL